MALIDDFKARFPEFDSALVDQLFPPIDATWECYYGGSLDVPCEKEAALQLMAHLFVLEQGASDGNSGAVKDIASKSVGSVSVSYGNAQPSDGHAFWMTTRYGQRFWYLTSSNMGPHFV